MEHGKIEQGLPANQKRCACFFGTAFGFTRNPYHSLLAADTYHHVLLDNYTIAHFHATIWSPNDNLGAPLLALSSCGFRSTLTSIAHAYQFAKGSVSDHILNGQNVDMQQYFGYMTLLRREGGDGRRDETGIREGGM